MESLDETQRELFLMVYVEDPSLAEAAAVLQINAEAAYRRHFRALTNEHGAMPLLQPRWRRSRELRAETLWNLLTVADHGTLLTTDDERPMLLSLPQEVAWHWIGTT